jgi:hypothetical protein
MNAMGLTLVAAAFLAVATLVTVVSTSESTEGTPVPGLAVNFLKLSKPRAEQRRPDPELSVSSLSRQPGQVR